MLNTSLKNVGVYPPPFLANLVTSSPPKKFIAWDVSKPSKSPGQNGLASYQYAGLDRTVKLTYVIPDIDLSYISPDGEPACDARDPYTGWDRFGRTQDLRLSKGEAFLDQTLYGYDRSSQRTWREAPLATSGNDEAYQYDGPYQITDIFTNDSGKVDNPRLRNTRKIEYNFSHLDFDRNHPSNMESQQHTTRLLTCDVEDVSQSPTRNENRI